MKLTQLPNSAWVDLSTVTAIVPLPTDGGIRARIIIRHGKDNRTEILYANDDMHAQELADQYAAKVNAL